jgi:acyl-CoA thioesterase-2
MLDGVLQILDLEQIEVNMFRGRTRWTDEPRIFGGEVAGQALVAAGRTVPEDRHVHSLHAYFLRPGDPSTPVLYRVDTIRDGRSFTTRRVVALQHGEAIFNLAASFHVSEQGLRHQLPRLDATVPDSQAATEDLLTAADDRTRAWLRRLQDRIPVDVRFAEGLPRVDTLHGESGPPRLRVWLRSSQSLGEDTLMHVCAATYFSDLFLLAAALPPHGIGVDDAGAQMVSLDHAVWFHAPFRADEWLYYDMESDWMGGARALCRGKLFDQAGTLVASVVQEGLVRVSAPSAPSA